MATQTPNYNLIKPDYTDPVDVDVLNDNADLIDAALTAKANLVGGKVPASELPSQTQADWSEADSAEPSYIQNKPTIPQVPIAVIEFTKVSDSYESVLTCGEIKALVRAGKVLIGRCVPDPTYDATAYLFIATVEFNGDTGGLMQVYSDDQYNGAMDPYFLMASTDLDVFAP